MSTARHLVTLIAVITLGQSNGQIIPVYSSSFQDPTMSNTRFTANGTYHWSVPSGADKYSIDQYERPTNQTYNYFGGIYASEGDYFGNLDIESGSFGYDAKYLYVRIDMVDTKCHPKSGSPKTEGLIYDYRFRINTAASGAGGYLFTTYQPGSQGTAFHAGNNFGYRDSNLDADRNGNGYETNLISDGKMSSGKQVLFSRINPADTSIVEFALEYAAVGLNPAVISSMVFESNKGLKDPGNYPWNKEYSSSQAGSPNGGTMGKSEFGTSGLGNIYELDTLKGVPGANTAPAVVVTPPTGKLFISKNLHYQGTVIPVGYEINRNN